MKTIWNIFCASISVFLLLVIVAFVISGKHSSDKKGSCIKYSVSINNMDEVLTKETLKAYMLEIKLVEPEICFKQVMLETGNLNPKSLGCLNNNMFCFSFDGVRVLKFDTWQESVLYYKFIQRYRWGIKKQDYYLILKRCWSAPDMESYINKLKTM